ncbi:MAG TPA: beta-galactosidase GalA [Bacillota bacterium]|nr:beta-galactosidase GalA [Bacillota bacterium]
MTNPRQRLSMDLDWRFHLGDIKTTYNKNYGMYHGFPKANNTGLVYGPGQAGFNDNDWEKVDLPHDWALRQKFDPAAASQGYKPGGIGWYRKCFRLEEADREKQLLLEFDGLATHATIFFNGSILKRNFCGYTSFVVNISDRAFFGDKPNTLAIRVDAETWEGWWYEGAGLYRHVWLTKKELVHFAHWGIWVNPQKAAGNNWITRIETTIESSKFQDTLFRLVSHILDPDGKLTGGTETQSLCPGGEKTVVCQQIPLHKPDLWDLDSPNLYTLVSELYYDGVLMDREETRYGYRLIRLSPQEGFFLNERPLKIKGTCNHQDHAGVGVALPDALHEYRIKRLKEMGSNAYRAAHHNPAPELLDACDRLGMLVMDENRNFESSPEGMKQFISMVQRDRNHPSVIFYSIFNEEKLEGTPQGRQMAQGMIRAIKQLDPSRPVLAAMNFGVMEDEGVADLLDVTGFNYHLDIYDDFHQKHPGQPMIGSENNCTLSTRGVYESDPQKQVFNSYDEEKAVWGNTIRETWRAVNSRDFVMGLFVWTGFDYRGEPTPYEWPSINSHWGVMDTCGFPKDGYYLHQACWSTEPLVHILPHWNWKGREGESIKVMSHTNCDEVELFLNGRSLGRKPSPIDEQAIWMAPYEPGSLKMVGYREGVQVAEDSTETTTAAVALKLAPDRDWLAGDGRDTMPVNVYALDASGHLVPMADHKVWFTIKGSGRILGVGNGDPNCHESDSATERSLFNGCCQAILQSLPGEDPIRFRVGAEGMSGEEVLIRIKPKTPPPAVISVHEQILEHWRLTRKIYNERPDPNQEISPADMNAWEWIEPGAGPQKKFDQTKGYALYRTEINLGVNHPWQSPVLFFYEVIGWVEVYINEKKLAEKACPGGAELEVPLPKDLSGVITISVLIKSSDLSPRAGISGLVSLK